jgi:hypothetical protein
MNELLIVIIGAALCWASFRLGIFYREWVATQKVQEYLKSLEHIQKEVQKYIVHIHITKENDTFYVYNETTGEFLAQGKDHKEIVKILRERYPQSTFTATPQNLVATGFKLQDDAF